MYLEVYINRVYCNLIHNIHPTSLICFKFDDNKISYAYSPGHILGDALLLTLRMNFLYLRYYFPLLQNLLHIFRSALRGLLFTCLFPSDCLTRVRLAPFNQYW